MLFGSHECTACVRKVRGYRRALGGASYSDAASQDVLMRHLRVKRCASNAVAEAREFDAKLNDAGIP